MAALSAAGFGWAAPGAGSDAASNAAWRLIAPLFQPPPEFADRYGDYRSPLLFADGTPVARAADWPRRRAEILSQWHELMGPWPPLLQKPKVEILSQSHRENFTQYRVRVELAPRRPSASSDGTPTDASRPSSSLSPARGGEGRGKGATPSETNQPPALTGEGWLLVPDGYGPFPAVLVVFYEPETSIGLGKKPGLDFGLQLARRGFVTLSIGTPGGDSREPDLAGARCQPLSFHAYVAANAWQALANRPEVDAARIGVVGHSYGGKWAMFASCLFEKFACAVWSDPGIVFDETRPNVNYWEPWYLGFDPVEKRPARGLPTATNPRTGAYKKMIETGRDLHELHALMAPRPFLVSGGSEDPPSRWLALNHTVAVNRLLGYTHRVAMSNRKTHAPTPESNAQLCAFFEWFLKFAPPGPGTP